MSRKESKWPSSTRWLPSRPCFKPTSWLSPATFVPSPAATTMDRTAVLVVSTATSSTQRALKGVRLLVMSSKPIEIKTFALITCRKSKRLMRRRTMSCKMHRFKPFSSMWTITTQRSRGLILSSSSSSRQAQARLIWCYNSRCSSSSIKRNYKCNRTVEEVTQGPSWIWCLEQATLHSLLESWAREASQAARSSNSIPLVWDHRACS